MQCAYHSNGPEIFLFRTETPAQTTSATVDIDFVAEDAVTVLSPREASFLQMLNYLQRIHDGIDNIKSVRIDAPIVRNIFSLADEIIQSLYRYAHQLDYDQVRMYDARVECKQLTQTISNETAFNRSVNRLCCLDDKPCVGGEKLVLERRLLAALSLICSECPSLTQSLLDLVIDININDADVDTSSDMVRESFVDLLALTLTNIAFLVSNLDLFDRRCV